MADLGVYLADLPGIVKWPAPLRQRVEEFFTKVVKVSGKFDNAKVAWTKSPPTLGDHDLLVYFVRDRLDSIVKPGINPKATLAKDLAGVTLWQTGTGLTGSEVYLYGHLEDSEFLARMAFHELMHNVSWTGDGLHAMKEHKKKTMCLSAERLLASTALCDGDIQFMADHLTTGKRKQWDGGFSVYNDPLRGT
jgi:hypothetical protein